MKKFLKDNKYAALGITSFLVICASAFAIYVIFNFSTILGLIKQLLNILRPIIDGVALAYILTPLLNFVENNWVHPVFAYGKTDIPVKNKKRIRAISITITYAIFAGILYLFFRLVIPQLVSSIRSIVYQLPRYVNNLQVFVDDLLKDEPEIEKAFNNVLNSLYNETTDLMQNTIIPQAENLLKIVSLSVIKFVKSTINIIIGLIISIYLMFSKELMTGQGKKILFALYETREANKIISGIRYTHQTFTGFLFGKLVDSIIIGVLCFIVISIADIPYAILVSVIVGVTNIIPFFGPYIGAIPSTLLILMINPLKALYFVIIILIIQQIDGNIIGPKILGDSTGLSSFWVVFSITIFGGLFGVAGWVLGVPTFGVIYALIRYKVNKKLKSKGLPQETGPYINVGSISKDGTFMEYVPIKSSGFLEVLGFRKNKKVKAGIMNEADSGDDNISENEADNNSDNAASSDKNSDNAVTATTASDKNAGSDIFRMQKQMKNRNDK